MQTHLEACDLSWEGAHLITSPNNTKTSPDRKRKCETRNEDDQFLGDEDHGIDLNRHQPYLIKSEGASNNPGFACPFRKHDARQYCVDNWRPCALTSFQTIARVKGHLYRAHLIYPCPRCKKCFSDKSDLESHLVEANVCKVESQSGVGGPEGITPNIAVRLRSRKKSYRDQSSEERWGEIYRMLFPTEEVPSPYYGPVREYESRAYNLLGPPELTRYKEYLRQQVPCLVTEAIDTAVQKGTHKIEDQLKAQILEWVRTVQDQALTNYPVPIASVHVDAWLAPTDQTQSPELRNLVLEPLPHQSKCALEKIVELPRLHGDMTSLMASPWASTKDENPLRSCLSQSYYASSMPNPFSETLRRHIWGRRTRTSNHVNGLKILATQVSWTPQTGHANARVAVRTPTHTMKLGLERNGTGLRTLVDDGWTTVGVLAGIISPLAASWTNHPKSYEAWICEG
ncbi:hypothetical protein N431DRAFT_482057 [Stipitochalara longipes BDJ]|nr:hypothetical protein N431DRAFT_482057 [Stipitochalara longipes BDJ]